MKLFWDERRGRFGLLIALLGLILICSILQVFADYTVPGLRYDRNAVLAGQAWRLLTGNLVHLGGLHLLFNLGTVLIFWLLFGRALSARPVILVFVLACLGTGAGLLLFNPSITWYVGLSGCLYGLLVYGGLATLRTQPLLSSAVLIIIMVKLGYEKLVGPLPGYDIIGASVITDAHLYGAIMGLLAGAGCVIRPALSRDTKSLT
jgi:rhomboid family GlyGly-CTERM serine protease